MLYELLEVIDTNWAIINLMHVVIFNPLFRTDDQKELQLIPINGPALLDRVGGPGTRPQVGFPLLVLTDYYSNPYYSNSCLSMPVIPERDESFASPSSTVSSR